MSIFSLKNRSKPRLNMAIDIGTYALRGVVYSYSDNRAAPTVQKKLCWELLPETPLERKMEKLHGLLFTIIKDIEQVPDKINIAIGPELGRYQQVSWTVSLDNKKYINFNKSLDHLFQESIKNKFKSKEGVLIAFPIGVEINGYPLLHIFDKKSFLHLPISRATLKNPGLNSILSKSKYVQEITFNALFINITSRVSSWIERLRRSWGGLAIDFLPFPVIQAEVIVNHLGVKDALWADIGMKHTIVGIIKNFNIVFTEISSYSLEDIGMLVADRLKITQREAMDLLKQYTQGLINIANQSDLLLSRTIAEGVRIWSQHFVSALERSYPFGPLPENVFIFGGGAELKEIREFFTTPEWRKKMSYTERSNLKVLSAEAVFAQKPKGVMLSGPVEFNLSALMHYNSKELNTIPPSTIFIKVYKKTIQPV